MNPRDGIVIPVVVAISAIGIADLLVPPGDHTQLDYLGTDLLALAFGLALGVVGAGGTTIQNSLTNSGSTGGGGDHENMPPYNVLNYIIRLT